ncbi:MAG: MBL fold metallo-hydrolase [Oscillospiraceae bacterium]|nr:MBL fold metallo-hydrolase [Oscillospiraceae bacterium]
MIKQIHGNLYRLQVDLPGNPLKWLNSYVIVSPQRSLIIDTGFNRPECLDTLRRGIRELGLDMDKTDVLATHVHADHTGLISQTISADSKVYMGHADAEIFRNVMSAGDTQWWNDGESRFRQEGYPEEKLTETRLANPARKFISEGLFEVTSLHDGDILRYGEWTWEVVSTPGHTPGHICLYERQHNILFTGDHLLFDITPNIAWWRELEDPLSHYFASLHKISSLNVNTVLTGHRQNEGTLEKRIPELLKHHEERLDDVLNIVQENPYSTGYEIASKMHWSIRAKSWADFPPGQRWFAVGEAISHIDHLVLQGRLQRHSKDGVHTYAL